MAYYRIVNLILESPEMPERFSAFRTEDVSETEKEGALRISYPPANDLTEAFETAAQVSGLRIGPSEGGWIFEEAETGLRMRVDAAYSEAEIAKESMENPAVWAFFLQLFLEGRLLDEGVLTLHSSCVELDGKAYSFSGPSGCGKSTRARQWVFSFGADYISGDRPAMHVKEKCAYGIPWDGKERIFRSVKAEVGAILEVRRSFFTRIRRLSAKQARTFLISQIYVPMWDSERAMEAMILLNRLVKTFPVYRLFCYRDENAALESRRILCDNQNEIRKESIDMKLQDGFVLKSMAGEHVLMPTGENIQKFNGTVLLNELSAFIIRKLSAGPLSKEDLADLILAEYEVEREVVLKDLDELTQQLSDMGVLTLE